MEIQILIEDNKIYDLDGEDLDNFEIDFVASFEKSKIGKVMLGQGFKCIDRDFDDNTLMVTYRKKGNK